MAENDFGTGGGFDAQELGADRNARVGADFDLGANLGDAVPQTPWDLSL